MRAVLVLFDSLNRRYLPIYGNDWVIAPNFVRLAQRAVVFDNCYGGSMPCIPARREMHTGRLNFLHRGWGPLEPFDDSLPLLLHERGVYSHLVTDHQHYFEPGGATYHTSFDTWEFVRGQEGDRWKGHVADPEIPPSVLPGKAGRWRQDWVNRQYLGDESDYPQTKVFDLGLEFIETNHAEDRWFVQIESFDPHEPFNVPDRFRELYEDHYAGPHFDWPRYARAVEDPEARRHIQIAYASLVSMCDHSLGRVLDAFDRHGLWDDTMLLVGTDHGFMLGERGWWAKNIQPWFNDNIHTPLVMWDPRQPVTGSRRRSALVQTMDFAPTLLDFFGAEATPAMEGVALGSVIAEDTPVREAALFGSFGGHVNVTDGRYVYMRAAVRADNRPLFEYTLMPARMDAMMGAELTRATLAEPFSFTRQMPVLRIPGGAVTATHRFGSMLFDLETDPHQEHPIVDRDVEMRMATLMVEMMKANDAPIEQFERLGLPHDEPVSDAHLVLEQHHDLAVETLAPLPGHAEIAGRLPVVDRPIADLLADEQLRGIVDSVVPGLSASGLARSTTGLTLYEVATMVPGVLDRDRLERLADALTHDQ